MKDTHSCGTFAVAIEVVANLPTTFASLDSDLVRSIAAALLVHGPVRSPNCAVAAASYKVCLDRRAPSVSALSRTSKSVREALSSMLNIMRAEHDKRMMLLSAFSTEVLQTDLQVLQRARDATRASRRLHVCSRHDLLTWCCRCSSGSTLRRFRSQLTRARRRRRWQPRRPRRRRGRRRRLRRKRRRRLRSESF